MDHKNRLNKYSQVKQATKVTQRQPGPANTPRTPESAPTTSPKKHSRLSTLRSIKHTTIARLNTLPLSPRSKGILAVAAAVVIACIVVGIITHVQAKESTNSGRSGQLIENLEYQTVLPTGKSITELGGWKRVSPPEGEPVYAYSDTLDGVAISVSQQPLPQSFQGNVAGGLEELAKKFNATTELEGGDTKAYIGASSKGPQSVLFTKNSLLVLMKSQNTISNTTWTNYIKTLQ